MGDYIIARKDSLFNSYINNTADYLAAGAPATNGVRLGLTPTEVTAWDTRRDSWNTNYALYTDDNTRTKTITDTKNNQKDDFIDFATPLLNRMATSAAITLADRNTLNLKERDTVSTARPAITTAPTVKAKAAAGATINFECRVESDSSRTSRHPDSDAAEVRYIVGTTPPANPAACTRSHISAKARFTLELDIADAGKKLYAFVRWVNLSDASKNGPWSAMVVVTITE
jgi:hypothetical protein